MIASIISLENNTLINKYNNSIFEFLYKKLSSIGITVCSNQIITYQFDSLLETLKYTFSKNNILIILSDLPSSENNCIKESIKTIFNTDNEIKIVSDYDKSIYGMLINNNNNIAIILPKSEHEIKSIFNNHIKQYLKSYLNHAIDYSCIYTPIENIVGELLLKNNLKISVAESCTGGMIASKLVSIPGISQAFIEGLVTYCNDSKIKNLKVNSQTLEKYSDVSEQTAREMVLGIAKKTCSDVAISTTGIAGPGGYSKNKPAGLVYIGIYYKDSTKIYKYIFNGSRNSIRLQATITALNKVKEIIMENTIYE